MKTFSLLIVKMGETLHNAEAAHLTITTTEGQITLLPHHAPLVTPVEPRTITVRTPDGTDRTMRGGRGILEFADNSCTVLL